MTMVRNATLKLMAAVTKIERDACVTELTNEEYESLARAALSAMMDATPGMVEAGASCALGWVDETEMWQAMVSAALDEGKG